MLNEVTEQPKQELSSDINIITAEINAYKQVAGEAIFEIGRRLKHVKENDLVHGEFMQWLESVEIEHTHAKRLMKIAEELGEKRATLHHLGTQALYLIATLPESERTTTHTTSKGEHKTPAEMTVRELRQLKADLKKAEERAEVERKERERLEELGGNTTTYSHLGLNALDLIATLPEMIRRRIKSHTQANSFMRNNPRRSSRMSTFLFRYVRTWVKVVDVYHV